MNPKKSMLVAVAALSVLLSGGLAALDVQSESGRAYAATPTVSPTTVPTTPVPTTTVPTTEPTPTEPAPTATPEPTGWHPEPGVRFNEPRRAKKSHVISRYIRQAIRHTRKGEEIRIVTWNFSSGIMRRTLETAHRRGVSVQIVMANGLAQRQRRNGPYGRLKAALEVGNEGREPGMESWFRVCKNSCRGSTGIQHGKWLMFSRTGGVDKVVMSTSANITDAAATAQWNDLLTVTERKRTWHQYSRVFNQMSKDRRRAKAFYTFKDGPYRGWFFPQMGKSTTYFPAKLLRPVTCTGATNVPRGTRKGRTVIRVGQAVFNGRPGSAVAARLRELHSQGCDVKIVYGVLNRNASRLLKGIPKKTYLQDTNGDGFVDRYIHMKTMTIAGHYGKNRHARVVYQGSANWSGMSTLSDEQGFVVRSKKLERSYRKEVNRLFDNPPPQDVDLVKYIELRGVPQDPFKYVRDEMGLGSMQPAL